MQHSNYGYLRNIKCIELWSWSFSLYAARFCWTAASCILMNLMCLCFKCSFLQPIVMAVGSYENKWLAVNSWTKQKHSLNTRWKTAVWTFGCEKALGELCYYIMNARNFIDCKREMINQMGNCRKKAHRKCVQLYCCGMRLAHVLNID